jgi:hypothetical protein
MSDPCFSDRRPPKRAANRFLLLGLAVCLAGAGSVRADEPRQAQSASRALVGKCVTPSAALLHRRPGGRWQLIKPGEPVYSGESLVALSGASIANDTGSVLLSLWPDLDRLSSLPVLESAAILKESPGKDLDFTFERGRVEVTNKHKGKEPARVRVHFGKNQTWDLTLATPGARVALVLYGRWPRGTSFRPDAKTGEEPTADLSLFVLNGEVLLDTHTDQYALHDPPGPAFFHWDSVVGADAGPERRDQLPDWARRSTAAKPQGNELTVALGRLRQHLESTPVREALTQMVHSPDAGDRRIAVYALGAVDDLPDLLAALADSEHEDTREAAIVTLRAWIGRGPGQDTRLYDFLVQSKDYSRNQAETVVQLLHSFGENQLARPATYGALIDYLLNDKLAIRQLAIWHLDRLVPAGRAILYDPAGSSQARQEAFKQWKKLVPNGKLPAEGTRK